MSVRRSPSLDVDRLCSEKAALRTRHVVRLYFHISRGNQPGNKTSLTKTRWSAKNRAAFTLTGRSQVGSHCPEGNRQIQRGFVDCGKPPEHDASFLSRSPRHLRYSAEPSLCRKRNENEPLVTPEHNRLSFLTYMWEPWWNDEWPRAQKSVVVYDTWTSLFSLLLEIQSQWNICSGIRHHQYLSDQDPANSPLRYWSISVFV